MFPFKVIRERHVHLETETFRALNHLLDVTIFLSEWVMGGHEYDQYANILWHLNSGWAESGSVYS